MKLAAFFMFIHSAPSRKARFGTSFILYADLRSPVLDFAASVRYDKEYYGEEWDFMSFFQEKRELLTI